MTLFIAIAAVLVVLFGVIAFDRWRWKRDTGRVPKFGSAGNALLEIQALFEADKRHVLEMRQEQEQKKEQEESGDPPPSGLS